MNDLHLESREHRGLTRRQLLQYGGASALLLAGGSWLAGCAPGGGTSTASATVALTRGGTMAYGLIGGSAFSSMDAHTPLDPVTIQWAGMLYEQLAVLNGSFELENVLAEEFSANADATSWTVRLKSGIEFHNGKTVSADDVIASFTRVLDPANRAVGAGQVSMIESMTKLDDLTVRFDLNRPTGWFDIAVSDGTALGIVPADYDPADPVGTGPWKYKSFTAGVTGEVERFDDYHGQIALLDSITLPIISDLSAMTNALLSGQIDAVSQLSPSSAATVQSNPDLTFYDLPGGGYSAMTMRVDEGDLADPLVRQALQVGVDRQAIVDSAYNGYAQVGNDLYALYDPLYASDLVRERDVDQARSLLKQAGKSDLNVTITVSELTPGSVAAAQVFAQSATEFGATVQVDEVDVATLLGANYLQWPFSQIVQPAARYTTAVSALDAPTASSNATHWDDDEYTSLWETVSSATDDATRTQCAADMQQIMFERGGYIIPAFPDTLFASSSKLGGWPTVARSGLTVTRTMNEVGYIG
ncbi:MAG: ABC transporter substrate-binding protein [Microbacterium sp.]|uniref:ABC transporter substrate-binding protein n=1 Tax=Microbacterium sp. TaxID=51671 RepID=UPI0039E5DBDB